MRDVERVPVAAAAPPPPERAASRPSVTEERPAAGPPSADAQAAVRVAAATGWAVRELRVDAGALDVDALDWTAMLVWAAGQAVRRSDFVAAAPGTLTIGVLTNLDTPVVTLEAVDHLTCDAVRRRLAATGDARPDLLVVDLRASGLHDADVTVPGVPVVVAGAPRPHVVASASAESLTVGIAAAVTVRVRPGPGPTSMTAFLDAFAHRMVGR